MPFFYFEQSNSGGDYDANDNLSGLVVVEAPDMYKANEIAENLGIYFDGVESGTDCECCGDRWTRVCEEYHQTEVLDEKRVLQSNWRKIKGYPYAYVHYLDGTRLSFS